MSSLDQPLLSPHVEVVLEQLLLGLVSAAHVVAAALVGDELAVGLHHHRVEVLHPLHHVSRHRVARPQRQRVADQTLKMRRLKEKMKDLKMKIIRLKENI